MSYLSKAALVLGLAISTASAAVGSDWKDVGDIGPPSWVTRNNWLTQSEQVIEKNKTRGNTVTIIKHRPKGQTEKNWRKVHVFAHNPKVSKTPEQVMYSSLRREGENCHGKTSFFDDQRDRRTLVYFYECGRRKEDGMGRMTVVYLRKTKNGDLFHVSEQWRGKPYSVDKSNHKFFSHKDVKQIIRNLTSSDFD